MDNEIKVNIGEVKDCRLHKGMSVGNAIADCIKARNIPSSYTIYGARSCGYTGRTPFYGGVYINDNWEDNMKKTKIEKKIEELELKLDKVRDKLHYLKQADKFADFEELPMLVSDLLVEENKTLKLLEGYETLDNMYVSNVIINNDVVITIALNGEKAISKPENDDEFNFETAFFMNLVKLDDNVDTHWYEYNIHAAIEDIKNGGLK